MSLGRIFRGGIGVEPPKKGKEGKRKESKRLRETINGKDLRSFSSAFFGDVSRDIGHYVTK